VGPLLSLEFHDAWLRSTALSVEYVRRPSAAPARRLYAEGSPVRLAWQVDALGNVLADEQIGRKRRCAPVAAFGEAGAVEDDPRARYHRAQRVPDGSGQAGGVEARAPLGPKEKPAPAAGPATQAKAS
jgi:hypothetical protein